MNIWDIPVKDLCYHHLQQEHGELHLIYRAVLNQYKSYANNPEVKRWRGKLPALYGLHMELAIELESRGYKHFSELDLQEGEWEQDTSIMTMQEQAHYLRLYYPLCACKIEGVENDSIGRSRSVNQSMASEGTLGNQRDEDTEPASGELSDNN